MSDKAQMNEYMQTLFVDINFKDWNGNNIGKAMIKIPPDENTNYHILFNEDAINEYLKELQTKLIKDFEIVCVPVPKEKE